MSYFFLSLAIVLNIVGQFSLKYGVNLYTELSGVIKFPNILFTKYVALGFALYGTSALFWIRAISSINLNVAYPTLAFGYVLVYFVSALLFGEPISFRGVIGISFIVVGVILIHVK